MPHSSQPHLLTTTTLLLLTSLTTVLGAPIPKGGGGHGGGGSSGGGGKGSSSGGSGGSSSSSGDSKPLSKGEIAGIVIGVFFGCLLVFAVAFICTNIDWCIKKELQFYDWQARRKARKAGTERGYVAQEDCEDTTEKEEEWDESATDVPEADAGECQYHAQQQEDRDEYTDAPTGYVTEEGLKVQVHVHTDSVSEVTQVNLPDEDVQRYQAGAPEIQDQSGSWRDRLVGKWTRVRSSSNA